MRTLCGSLVLLVACSSAPEPSTPRCSDDEVKRIKKLAFEAETSFEAFSGLLECGEYSLAFLMLSVSVRRQMAEEEFILAMTNFDEMRRMMVEAEVHALETKGTTGRMRICNPEFRMSEEFPMVKEAGTYWTFELDPDQIRDLADGVLGWYDARNDDGTRHVYPSGYPHPDSRRRCPCGYDG